MAEVAYPYRATREPEAWGVLTPIPPPVEWEPQIPPEQDPTKTPWNVDGIAVRSSDEIWLSAGAVRFRPSTHEMVSYTVKVGNSEFEPYKLFLSKDGTLWGLGNLSVNGKRSAYMTGEFLGFLSRYNADADRFEAVMDEDKILTGFSVDGVGEDAQGNLWLAFENNLVRYDPRANKAERRMSQEQGYGFRNFAFAPDGAIWLAAHVPESPYRAEQVVRYDPITGEIKSYGKFGIPPGTSENSYLVLYFDRVGRLWANDYGWLEIPPEFPEKGSFVWYELIRSPIFITDRAGGEYKYGWVRPDYIYEDSTGIFWFSSVAGLARFDPDSGDWCLVSTVHGPVVEDSEHNLWVAGEGQIYKYRLQP